MTDRIRELRIKRHLRQRDVVAALRVSPRMYSAYETGRIPWTCRMLMKLAIFYEVNADCLVGWTAISALYPPPKQR